jgi:WD40 repeat protein
MKRYYLTATTFLIIGLVLTGCKEIEEGPEPLVPTSIPTTLPTTQVSSQEPPPTESVVLPTLTSTPVPLPTPTPTPPIPDRLALLNYQSLSQVEQLLTISMPDVMDLEFSPDGHYLRLRVPAGEETHQDIIYDLETGEETFSLEGGQQTYFYPDSTSLTALEGNTLTIYKLPGGGKKSEYNSEYQVAALSPDGRLVAEFEVFDQEESGTTLHVVDLKTEQEIFWVYINGKLEKDKLTFDIDGRKIGLTYFVPPGTYVSTIWDTRTGRVIYTEYGFTEIVLHPFGSEVAGASSRRSYISLISTVTWEQKHYLGSAEDEPGYYDIAYSSAGRLIYALSDRESTTASFWYPPSGEQIDLDLHLDLLAVTISPDRRFLATSDKDGSVTIWGVPE